MTGTLPNVTIRRDQALTPSSMSDSEHGSSPNCCLVLDYDRVVSLSKPLDGAARRDMLGILLTASLRAQRGFVRSRIGEACSGGSMPDSFQRRELPRVMHHGNHGTVLRICRP